MSGGEAADVWQLFVKPRLRFRSAELLVCNDAELGFPSRHYAVMWVSQMSAEREPRLQQRRISFARGFSGGAEPLLEPTGYTLMQAGQADRPHRDIVFPRAGLELGCRDMGVPTSACLEFVVRGDCANDTGMLAQYTVGACSISLLQLHQRLRAVAHYPVVIRVPLILRASQDTSTAVLELEVMQARFDDTRLHEVFDATMSPLVSGPVLMTYASLGWLHLPQEGLDGSERIGNINLSTVGIKPLIPVASRSMVPFCNESSGVLPVDLFFRVHNGSHLPRPNEQHWLRVVEQALWLRGLSVQEGLELCKRNFELRHYEPRFELVISAVQKMFSQRGTSFPYRSDLATKVTDKGRVVRVGTDYFWQCESQRSGDCEDSDKTIKDQIDLFMARKMNDPLLRYVQRLCACWVPGGVLANVTSPSLKHEEHAAHAESVAAGGAAEQKTPFTPLAELECGLHAVCIHYPLVQFKRDLAATVGEDAVSKLNFFGGICVAEEELPHWADEVGMAVLEGTGNLDARLQAFHTYVERQLARMGAADAAKYQDAARELIAHQEARMSATRAVLSLHPALMETLGAKPEMSQFSNTYEYNFAQIWSGQAAPASHFYVAGVEFYTDRLLNAGHKYCRFVFVTRASAVGGSASEWLKVAPFDAMVAADEHVGLWPQPPLTEDVLKCAMVLANRMEPIAYVDYHEQDAAVDAVIQRAQRVFGKIDYQAPSGAANTIVAVDLHFQNGLLAGEKLVPRVDSMAEELRRTSYVKATTFRLFNHGAGIASGVLRLHVDTVALEQARQIVINTSDDSKRGKK